MDEPRNEILCDLEHTTAFRYPMCWASDRTTWGDFEGRERTLEIFNIESSEQLGFLRSVRESRRQIEAKLGGPLTFVFHTPEATRQHYSHLFPAVRGVVFECEGIQVDLPPGGVGSRVRVGSLI